MNSLQQHSAISPSFRCLPSKAWHHLLRAIALIAVLTAAAWCRVEGSMLGKYNMSTLNMASGMPNNFADDIFQDSYGFVWICTHGGLVRYDGYNYEVMGLGAPSVRLRSNHCRNVAEDRFRRLWIAFEEGPQVLDLTTMHPFQPKCSNAGAAQSLRKVFDGTCKPHKAAAVTGIEGNAKGQKSGLRDCLPRGIQRPKVFHAVLHQALRRGTLGIQGRGHQGMTIFARSTAQNSQKNATKNS